MAFDIASDWQYIYLTNHHYIAAYPVVNVRFIPNLISILCKQIDVVELYGMA